MPLQSLATVTAAGKGILNAGDGNKNTSYIKIKETCIGCTVGWSVQWIRPIFKAPSKYNSCSSTLSSNIPFAWELVIGFIPTGLGPWIYKIKGNCVLLGDHSLMHPVHMQIFLIKLTAICLAQLMQAALQDSHPDASLLVTFLFISLPAARSLEQRTVTFYVLHWMPTAEVSGREAAMLRVSWTTGCVLCGWQEANCPVRALLCLGVLFQMVSSVGSPGYLGW